MTKNKELDSKIAKSVYQESNSVAEKATKKISEEKAEAKTSVFELKEEAPTGSREPEELIFESSDEPDFCDKDSDKKKPRRKKGLIILVGTILAALLIGGVAYGFINQQNSNNQSDSKSAPENQQTLNTPSGEKSLPVVDESAGAADVNTTNNPNTPATFQYIGNVNAGAMKSWKNLYDFVNANNAQWYKNAIDARKVDTGFGWSDVEKWANDADLNSTTTNQLSIEIFGGNWTDDQARAIAAQLVGTDVSNVLPIIRQTSGTLINTRCLQAEQVTDFIDQRQMVRVSLSPVIYKDGKAVGISKNSGVFVDCLNIWYLGTIPNTTPSTPTTTTPSTPITPYTPDNPDTPVDQKIAGQDPAAQGNAPEGGGTNIDPGPGQYIPPEQMPVVPEEPYVAPPKPTPEVETPPIGSTPDEEVAPVPEPEATTPEEPATGVVVAPGM